MLTIFGIVQSVSLVVVLAYLLMTFQSAIRMAMVHDRYAHIEFNGAKWQSYGKWAPQRLRTLARLRAFAIVALVVYIAASFGKGFVV